MKNIAINGFGRIGRAFLKLALNDTRAIQKLNIVAINDLGDLSNMIYLLKYDTVYNQHKVFKSVSSRIVNEEEKYLVLELQDGSKKEIRYISEKDTQKFISKKIWSDYKVDIVVECTGLFTSADKAYFHIDSGAKRVVLSAPTKDTKDSQRIAETVLMGVNLENLKNSKITSNASCTTNAISPVVAILHESLGIEKAILNTVHAYTASQRIVDGPDAKNWRLGRAGAQNIIPSTTGAAIAMTKAFTEMEGLFDGISLRVPVVAGSIADITFIAKRNTTVEEVNRILKNATKTERFKYLLAYSEEELVSSDILGLRYASIVDSLNTKVVGGNLVKILAWYDNEIGYTQTLVDHVIQVGEII